MTVEHGIAAACQQITSTADERDDLLRTKTRLTIRLEACEAECARLAGQLGTEEFRTKGWRDRALSSESILQQRDRDLADARADVIRLQALLGQGLDLADGLVNLGDVQTGEELRTALTVAPGERQITPDGKCGHNGGRGIGAGHVCTCVRGMNHPFDSDRPHGCSCGAMWADGDR